MEIGSLTANCRATKVGDASVGDEFFGADVEIRTASKSSNWKYVESGGLSRSDLALLTSFVVPPFSLAGNEFVARLFRGEGLLANWKENPRV